MHANKNKSVDSDGIALSARVSSERNRAIKSTWLEQQRTNLRPFQFKKLHYYWEWVESKLYLQSRVACEQMSDTSSDCGLICPSHFAINSRTTNGL